MMMSGTCPKCDKHVMNVLIKTLPLKTNIIGGKEFHGVSYLCPSCRTVLGVDVDPISLKNEIVSEVVEELLSRLRK